jgi:hypothetical protein
VSTTRRQRPTTPIRHHRRSHRQVLLIIRLLLALAITVVAVTLAVVVAPTYGGPWTDDRHLACPHGAGLYMFTSYPVGVAGARDRFVEVAHREIEALAEQTGITPCREPHVEDIELWQIPHSGRAQVRAACRQMEHQTGRHVAILRCWRHSGGACPDDTPPADNPLLDTPPGGTR